ncbi:MAG: hypothetical protein PF495_21580 [Spirochaetales bacterium]|nr:hypothetical protein [Spirochaetales bacterium]
MDYISLMQTRRSVRSFSDKTLPVDIEKQVGLLTAAEDFIPDFFDGSSKPVFLPGEVVKHEKLGTYGVIHNHQGILTGLCGNTDLDILQFGFFMEKVLLTLRKRDIESCWMGGTYKRGAFRRLLSNGEHSIIPAIFPLGYPADKIKPVDWLLRTFAGSNNRKQDYELFFRDSFSTPYTDGQDETVSLALEAVRSGPSASNKQPWRIILSKNNQRADFYLHESPSYNKSLGYPIQMLDMGIAMCHYDLALRQRGEKLIWEYRDFPPLNSSGQIRYIATCSRIIGK